MTHMLQPPSQSGEAAEAAHGRLGSHIAGQLPLKLEVTDVAVASSSGRRRGESASAGAARGSAPPILLAIRKEAGLGLPVLKRVQKHHPGDPLRQVSEFFAEFTIPAATGRKRSVGMLTERLYITQMRVMVADLDRLNMALQNLGEFSARHVRALNNHYERQGLSSSSLQKKNTVLRRFGTWIGKPDMTPRLRDLVMDPARARRSYSATESKAWTAKGVAPTEVIARMEAECPVAGLQLLLCLVFGLRPREAVMFKPVAADQGRQIFVTDGTKGGRARMLPVDTVEKRDILERAKAVAANNRRGVLSDKPSRTLKMALRHFYYLAEKVGISRSGLGVTLHGLRHEFANRLFKEIAGVDSPVNGGRLEDRELVRTAMQRTSEQLGHGRKDAGAAYLGSARHMDFTTYKNLRELSAALDDDAAVIEAVRAMGPASWWVYGPAAEGKARNGQLQLAYSAEEHGTVQAVADLAVGQQAMRVALAAGNALGCVGSVIPYSALTGRDLAEFELIGLSRASRDRLVEEPAAIEKTPETTPNT